MRIRTSATALLLLLALTVGACGSTPPAATTQATEPSTTATEGPAGPSGPIDFDGVGPAKQGMTSDEIERYFGKPVGQDVVPGCPLDANAKKQLVLKYDLSGGQLTLTFTTGDTDALLSTFTDSPELETVQGIKVGDSYDDLKKAAGDELKPENLGAEATPEQGFWYVAKAEGQWITYDVDKGKVARILSGNTPACE
jgi:hypothetical protein